MARQTVLQLLANWHFPKTFKHPSFSKMFCFVVIFLESLNNILKIALTQNLDDEINDSVTFQTFQHAVVTKIIVLLINYKCFVLLI